MSPRSRKVSPVTLVLIPVAIGLVGNLWTSTVAVDAWWFGPLTALLVAVLVVWSIRIELARSRPASAEEAVASLRLAVTRQWVAESKVLSLANPRPMPVRWNLTAEPRFVPGSDGVSVSGEVTWSGSADRIDALAESYRALPGGRLIILGEAGAGKTTLAIQLLLCLAEDTEGPVPVLVSAAGWDPAVHPDFAGWFAARLDQGYGWLRDFGPDTAANLFTDARVIPVLDGLDEVPADVRPLILTGLNAALARRNRLIITCRRREYGEAVRAGQTISDSAVIEAEPMPGHGAAGYLSAVIGRTVPEPGWQDVIAHLEGEARGPLAETAANPLGLWLLRTTYADARESPEVLLDTERFPTASALRAHLFDRLIPTAIAARPWTSRPETDLFRPRRPYAPEQVTRWLGNLAVLLDHTPNPEREVGRASLGSRDLAWWRLGAGVLIHRPPGPFGYLGMVLSSVLWAVAVGQLALGVPWGWALTAAVIVLTEYHEGPAGDHWSWERDLPGSADVGIRGRLGPLVQQIRSKAVLPVLLFAVFGGVLAGLHVLAVALGAGDFPFTLALLVLYGLTFALSLLNGAVTAWMDGDAAGGPMDQWRADRRLTFTRAAAGAVTGAVIGGGVAAIARPESAVLVTALTAAAGALSAFVSGTRHAWPVYLIASARLARRGDLPRRLMRFLDDAHRLGLLRVVGPVYQFRHAEFQDHLSARLRPAPPPRAARPPTPVVRMPPRGDPADLRPVRVQTFEGFKEILDVAFHPGGESLALSTTGRTHVVDLHGKIQRTFRYGGLASRFERYAAIHAQAVHSPDGRWIAVAGGTFDLRATDWGNGKVWILDAATGARHREFVHDDWVNALAFSPDGGRIASGSRAGSTRIWDVADGTELLTIAHDSWVNGVAFSPDGTLVATGTSGIYLPQRDHRAAEVWDASTGAALLRLEGVDRGMSSEGVNDVAFSPDGTWLATAGDRVTRIWDVATGAAAHTIPEGSQSLAFSPDGLLLATAARAPASVLWNARTWAEVLRIPQPDFATRVAFDAGASLLATCCRSGAVQLWRLRPGA
ncbi:hypothetical protein ACTMTF_32705 [Nonomuraea sp. ZG12]|uniref:hypothetical protein n=1 Tax=Nonomuraea sp. ZG12 TaxID=3452207 RepID=UPI003F8AA6FE